MYILTAAKAFEKLVDPVVPIQTILTFHSIGPLDRQADDDEMLYNVSTELFSKWITAIAHSSPQCIVTFDDGNKSDLEIALPLLKKLGITAKFYPIVNRIGQHGYMTWDDLRTLVKEGMLIGSHGLEHVAWTECTNDQLLAELQQSRETLEKQLNTPILCAAAPFGAINPRVFRAVKKAGYKKLYTSSTRSSFLGSSLIPRYSIQSHMMPDDYIGPHTKFGCKVRSSLKNLVQNFRYNVSSPT